MKTKLNLARITFVMLFCVIICGVFVPKAKAARTTIVPDGYKAIRTIEDLVDINNNPSEKYILMNDIDLTEATKKGGSYDTGNGWTPLNEFSGVLNGNGYYIKGMHIYGDGLSDVGLFYRIRGIVTNLGMIDCDIDIKYSNNTNDDDDYIGIGTIAGCLDDGETSISKCFVSGRINVVNESATDTVYVGSLVGISSSYYPESDYDLDYDSDDIFQCYSNVKLYTKGCIEYAIGSGKISNCYFTGYSDNEKSRFYGDRNYYLSGSLKSDVYATELTQTKMRSKSSYTNWYFDKVWYIDPYSDYQYPQLRDVPQTRISGMEMVTMPNKTTYAQGEEISLEGATFRLVYNNGYTATVMADDNFKIEYNNLKIGKQDVKVSYLDGSMTFPVVFTGDEVSDIELTGTGTNVAYGNCIYFDAVVKPENALDNKLTWSVTTENGGSVAKEDAYITEDGVFFGYKMGKYIVTVKANNGISKSCMVNVTKPMVYLIPDHEELKINCGETAEIKLKQSPLDSTEDIYWYSSDENIATVENGVVKALLPGKVTITAKTNSGARAICYVSTIQDISLFDVTGLTTQIYTGKKITLKDLKVYGETGLLCKGEDYTVSYEDNVDIGTATVNIVGCGLYSGTISKTFEIVRGGLEKAKISNKSINLKVKKTKKLKISGAAGYTVKWSSQSKKIATVDKNGKVTAKKPGKTYIIAKVGAKVFKCKVVVRK